MPAIVWIGSSSQSNITTFEVLSGVYKVLFIES